MIDFQSIPNITPEGWKNSSAKERLAILQELEDRNARLQDRERCVVSRKNLGKNKFGVYELGSKSIIVNSDLISSDDPRLALRTVVHEGQHDYQWDCVIHPDNHTLVSDDAKLAYAANFRDYHSPGRTKKAMDRYFCQPVEVDAYNVEEIFAIEYEIFIRKERSEAQGMVSNLAPPASQQQDNSKDKPASPEHQQMIERARSMKASLQTSAPTSEPEKPRTLDHDLSL